MDGISSTTIDTTMNNKNDWHNLMLQINNFNWLQAWFPDDYNQRARKNINVSRIKKPIYKWHDNDRQMQ